jgi:hypothetical protein
MMPPELTEILKGMSNEQAIEMLQELANTHGLALASFPIPDGINKIDFVRDLMQKVEAVTGEKGGTIATPFVERILRQKAEIERANIQHCEHNSRAGLALQVVGMGLAQDEAVFTQPDSFQALFDTACNTLRDVITGCPSVSTPAE